MYENTSSFINKFNLIRLDIFVFVFVYQNQKVIIAAYLMFCISDYK